MIPVMICNTNKLDESVQRFALLHSPLEGEPFVSRALLICLIQCGGMEMGVRETDVGALVACLLHHKHKLCSDREKMGVGETILCNHEWRCNHNGECL